MIQITFENDGAQLERNGKVLFHLTEGRLVFDVGRGKTHYEMKRGSFKISEHVYERVPVRVMRCVPTEYGADVELDEGGMRIRIEGDEIEAIPYGFEKYDRMWLRLPAEEGERVYGGGENFTEFDLSGQKLNVWVAEHINAKQIVRKLIGLTFGKRNSKKKKHLSSYETYYASPTFVSTEKYYYYSLSSALTVFDFTSKKCHVIETGEIAPFRMGFADDYEGVMTLMSARLGRQPELPDWVYDGQILGVQGGTEVMERKLNAALESGAKVAGVWIQDWEGRRVTAVGKQLYWNWEWDKELYPDLDRKIAEYAARGIRVLAYCNPFLAIEKALYREASAKGYCVKDKEGKDYRVTITTFPAAMVDLSNPAAYEWLKNVIKKNLIGMGFSGWMADFGEYLPTDCVLYDGEDPELAHNTWPARWAKLNREAIEECGKLGEVMFFTRAGYTGTPGASTMMWNGDNHVDFSLDFGLPSVIPAMLNLTLSGFGLSHSDIGGYTSFYNLKRSPELYMRWAEMNAFSPLMRGHEGLNPDLNAQFDCSAEVLAHGARMSKIHAALKPYLKKVVKENAERGIGAVRPLFFYYDEAEAYREAYEYLLGRDLLVAPVLEEGAREREVYLPRDSWLHLPSGKIYMGGGRVTVKAEIGEPPVFVRTSADPQTVWLLKSLFTEA